MEATCSSTPMVTFITSTLIDNKHFGWDKRTAQMARLRARTVDGLGLTRKQRCWRPDGGRPIQNQVCERGNL